MISPGKTLDIRAGTVTEFTGGPPATRDPRKQGVDDQSSMSDDGRKLTARRATMKILRRFDRLIKAEKYKVGGKRPKFDFDSKEVAANFCDIYIDEDEEAPQA